MELEEQEQRMRRLLSPHMALCGLHCLSETKHTELYLPLRSQEAQGAEMRVATQSSEWGSPGEAASPTATREPKGST